MDTGNIMEDQLQSRYDGWEHEQNQQSFERDMDCPSCDSEKSIHYKAGLGDDGIWIKANKCTECEYMPTVKQLLER